MEYRSVLAKTSPRLQPAPVSLLPPRALRPTTGGWLAHKGASGSGPYHRVLGQTIASCSFTSARGQQLKIYAAPMSAPEALTSSDGSEGLQVVFDNTGDEECTVITVEGKDQSHLLMSLTGVFSTTGLSVVSASIQSDDGRVLDVFRVTTADGKKVPEAKFDEVRKQIIDMTSGSSRSNKPAIYGIVAAAEVERLRPLSASADQNDVQNLELTAAEMAQAAADLVAREREILSLRAKGADSSRIHAKESARAEAAAALERKMAAMEALLAARRALALVEPEKDKKKDVSAFIEQMKPAVAARASSGPGCGNGYEILLQAFNWESHKHRFYKTLQGQISAIAKAGFTAVWLPPPSDSVSPQGYLPRDLYQLDSAYGTESELRELISTCHDNNIKVIADIVINHRCANFQGNDGKWNKFGGRLAWDASAICCNNPAFGGRGAPKSGDDYAAAPNIDHSQERIRQDITGWLKYLRTSIGFDGWRLDFVRGYQGSYVKQYVDETVPEMAFGEYWDACEYTDGVLNYNQDAHRQRTINWCDSTGGTSAAFDFTTKGVLQEAVSRREYWRLVDSQGRPPGVMGMWPSRAITFVDNHDTGSTLNHWPFPANHIHEGYAYILTHPGTPTVFCDHLWQEQGGLRKTVLELTALRKKHGINCRTKCSIKKATNDVYAAVLDDKIAMKIGHGDWSPNSANVKPNGKPMKLAASGPNFAVWEVDS